MNRFADGAPWAPARGPARPEAAGGSEYLRTQRNRFASNDRGDDRPLADVAVAADEACHFEIFRQDEQRMTSTLFSGGDWRWRLVSSGGLILAEASGYPSETACRAAVAVLQRCAATAPVVGWPGDDR